MTKRATVHLLRPMTSREYLDACRKLTETGSDYALAKLLGVSEDAVNRYRKGSRIMSPTTCRKVAEVLGVPFAEVLAAAEADRASDPKERTAWVKLTRKRWHRAAALFLAALMVDTVLFPAIAEDGAHANALRVPAGHSVIWHAHRKATP